MVARCRLKTQFNRLDFAKAQMMGMPLPAVVNQIRLDLPKSAADVYYRDEIGNVSTSHYRPGVLEMQPRFPLVGGWRHHWYHGFNAPLSEFVSRDTSGHFVLSAPLLTPFSSFSVEDLVVKVVLPEGATYIIHFYINEKASNVPETNDQYSNVKVHLPFEVDAIDLDRTYTFFDTVGRPTVLITKKNLVNEHAQTFQVISTFSPKNKTLLTSIEGDIRSADDELSV